MVLDQWILLGVEGLGCGLIFSLAVGFVQCGESC